MSLQHIFCALMLLIAMTRGPVRPAAHKQSGKHAISAVDGPVYAAQSKGDAGYVLEVEGKWFIEKRPRDYLAVGQRLAAGDFIKILSPAASDHIVISGPSGEIIIKRYCDNRGDCARRLIVPSPTESESSVFEVILQTAMRLIRGKPDRYSVHGVRGVNNDLEEAVCRLDKDSLNLRPVFRNMPKGLYYLKLRNLQLAPTRAAIEPLRFEWDPQGGSVLRLSGLKPGIYEIRLLLRTGDQYESTPLTVWALISNPSEFDRTNDLFHQAVTLTGKWGEALTGESKRQVLRAYLDNLATAY